MSPTFRNILIVIFAVIFGSIIALFIQYLSHQIFPPPPGMDTNDIESVKAHISEVSAGSFALILLSHAIGPFISGIVISKFSVSNIRKSVFVAGAIWTITGIINLIMIPHPMWFMVADVCIYLPMTILGSKLLKQ